MYHWCNITSIIALEDKKEQLCHTDTYLNKMRVQCNTIKNGNTIQYKYNTIQYNTIQCNTIQYYIIQLNTIQYNTIQYNAIQFNTKQYNTIGYSTTTIHGNLVHYS